MKNFLMESIIAYRYPWDPHKEAYGVNFWVRDIIPLIGTFKMDSRTILFECVGKKRGNDSFWRYCVLPEGSEVIAEVYKDVSDLTDAVDVIFKQNESITLHAWGYSLQPHKNQVQTV